MLTNDETSHFRMLVGYSITAGLILHQFCKRVDIDKRPWSVLASVIATHALTIFELYTHTKIYNTFWSSSLVATALVSVTLATLFSSILVYRAFFHPLESFPGPFGAKLSRFWAVWKTYETGSKVSVGKMTFFSFKWLYEDQDTIPSLTSHFICPHTTITCPTFLRNASEIDNTNSEIRH